MKTKIVRVPSDFWDEVTEISRTRNLSNSEFLRKDGTRLLKNAKTLTELIYGRQ